jgi:hypothetical protein
MQNFEIDDRFGVTLMMLDCAFSAELQRDSISRVMTEIDIQLTEEGAPEDHATRVEMVMDNAKTVSTMVANRQIEENEGVTDIAYSFIYALGKTVGFDQVIHLRGLTGTFIKNVLSLNPCLGDLEYQQETATMQRAMATPDGNWSAAESSMSQTLH